MQRWALGQNLAVSGHVHVISGDGMWCVTGDHEQLRTLGPLWRKIRQPCPEMRPGGHHCTATVEFTRL